MGNTPLIAYSDKLDGKIQVAFTLPEVLGPKAESIGLLYCERLGLKNVLITDIRSNGNFTSFIAYGNCAVEVSADEVSAPERDYDHMTREQVEHYASGWTPIKVIGAALESDAHTVGLDAILNMKGYHGDYGLERYKCFEVVNMGAQVTVDELIAELRSDPAARVVLISQTVSQNDIHLKHLSEFKEALAASGLEALVICGGMHVTDTHAQELGFTAGFGRGTVPSQVASLIVTEIGRRQGWTRPVNDSHG